MLDYTIHYLSLSGIDDSRLQCLLGAIPTKSILLIEDIDAQLESLDTEYSKINLSTVLNSFDGVLAPDGIITIVTTNYKEKIDERVLRPGRINLEVEFGPLTEDQRTRLAALRGIDTDSFVTASESMLITK